MKNEHPKLPWPVRNCHAGLKDSVLGDITGWLMLLVLAGALFANHPATAGNRHATASKNSRIAQLGMANGGTAVLPGVLMRQAEQPGNIDGGRRNRAVQTANPIPHLAREMTKELLAAFPAIQGEVISVDGDLLEIRVKEPARLWTRQVEIYRCEPKDPDGRPTLADKIGQGRIISLDPPLAYVEVAAQTTDILPGDPIRSQSGTITLGIPPLKAARGTPRTLRELLLTRIVHELRTTGRFRASLLKEDLSTTNGENSHSSLAWRGVNYLLHLQYVEQGGEATLLGRLQRVEDGRNVQVVAVEAFLGPSWPTLVASLEESGRTPRLQVIHRQIDLGTRIVALRIVERADSPQLLALSRNALHVLSTSGGGIQEGQTYHWPASMATKRYSKDYTGAIVPVSKSRILLGHTLLERGLALNPSTGKFQQLGGEINLSASPNWLWASYFRGGNTFRSIRAGDRPLPQPEAGLRFANWIAPNKALVQEPDYRLALLDLRTGERRTFSGSVGAGVSLIRKPIVAVAVTEPLAGEELRQVGDRVSLYRLGSRGLELIWRSSSISGPVRATTLGWAGNQLHLLAAEERPHGSRLHLYSGIGFP